MPHLSKGYLMTSQNTCDYPGVPLSPVHSPSTLALAIPSSLAIARALTITLAIALA